jgi:hypothetical protein
MKTPARIKRIVAVRFDDGTERGVTDIDLMQYLETRNIEDAFPTLDTQFVENILWARAQLSEEETSATNRTNASKPRRYIKTSTGEEKPITKAELIAFEKKFETENATSRGWRKAACLEFGITYNTLTKKMSE